MTTTLMMMPASNYIASPTVLTLCLTICTIQLLVLNNFGEI